MELFVGRPIAAKQDFWRTILKTISRPAIGNCCPKHSNTAPFDCILRFSFLLSEVQVGKQLLINIYKTAYFRHACSHAI